MYLARNNFIVLQGFNLNAAITKDEIEVMIQNYVCLSQPIVDDAVQCSVPEIEGKLLFSISSNLATGVQQSTVPADGIQNLKCCNALV